MDVKQLKEKRSGLIKQVRALMDEAQKRADFAEKGLTTEERAKYDAFMGEIDTLKTTIEQEERTAALDAEMRAATSTVVLPTAGAETRGGTTKEQEEYRAAFISHLKGENSEKRALTVATHGNVVLPNTLFDKIIEGVKARSGIRQAKVSVLPNVAGTVRLTVGNDTKKGHRVNAGAATTSDPSSLAGKTLTVYDYTSDVIVVDRSLLNGSPQAVESYLSGLLSDRIVRIVNEECTTGTGTGMPEGVLAAATLGYTGATTNGITYNEMVELEHSVPAQFRVGAQWMFADSTLKALKKLVDSEGKPLWNAGSVALGTPPTFMGYGYIINDDMPALGAGNKAILFGDFSRYFVADGPTMTVQVLNELYAANNQVGLVLFSSHGGALADAAGAVKYFQNAAS
jgi:HK97 family phage major capsid protein